MMVVESVSHPLGLADHDFPQIPLGVVNVTVCVPEKGHELPLFLDFLLCTHSHIDFCVLLSLPDSRCHFYSIFILQCGFFLAVECLIRTMQAIVAGCGSFLSNKDCD